MKEQTAFEALSGVRDDLIVEAAELLGLLDMDAASVGRRPKRERGEGPVSRFMDSSWGVALLCAVVSLSILSAIIWAGNHPPSGRPPVPPVDTQTDENQETNKPDTSTQGEETLPPEPESTDTVEPETETEIATQPDTLAPEEFTMEELESKILVFDPNYEPTISVFEYWLGPHLGGFDKVQHVNEVEWDLGDAMKLDPSMDPPTKTDVQFSMNGENFEATYVSSTTSSFYRDQYHQYTGTDQYGERVSVSYHAESGRFAGFRNFHWEAIRNETLSPPLTEKECEQIARNLIFEIARLPGDYKMTVKYDRYGDYETDIYDFYFIRMIDHMESDEYAYVMITDRGRILSYNATRLGCMDGVSLPTYDEEEVMKAVEHKLAMLYAPLMESFTCSYVVNSIRLTRPQDGNLYLKYDVSVYWQPDPEDDLLFAHDLTNLLVPLN